LSTGSSGWSRSSAMRRTSGSRPISAMPNCSGRRSSDVGNSNPPHIRQIPEKPPRPGFVKYHTDRRARLTAPCSRATMATLELLEEKKKLQSLKQFLHQFSAPAAEALIERQGNGDIQCFSCGHRCLVKPGRDGVCRVRFNDNGVLQVPYGY